MTEEQKREFLKALKPTLIELHIKALQEYVDWLRKERGWA